MKHRTPDDGRNFDVRVGRTVLRYSRNPLYLATMGLYVGAALLIPTISPLLLLVPLLLVLHWGVIAREERYLSAKFGAPYEAYRARVRRWL